MSSDIRIETLDLGFQGQPRVIAAFLIHGPGGPVLVESGPGSTLPTLLARLEERGLQPADVKDVLVTHIHLDHAGAAGWWAQQGARVWVHSVGAPHLVDPSKLLSSAARIYGDRMDILWGEVLPAPADRVHAVEDGDTLEVGGMQITAIDTPGHAWHHHVYKLDDIAFTGDAAGIQLPAERWIDLPAPPPEFDQEAWKKTLDRLRGLGLRTLYRTHFGASSDVDDELDRFEETLNLGVDWIRGMLDQGLEREQMIEEFSGLMRSRAAELGLDEADTRAYELANPRVMSVDGITRYLRKRGR
jgi:glyoxylase-like metal-dependent hydrolase (beta-lactamase superfamily II)